MQDVDGVEDICPTHVGMNRNALGYRHKLCEICPTHVGMNRRHPAPVQGRRHLPHARGDEPSPVPEPLFL